MNIQDNRPGAALAVSHRARRRSLLGAGVAAWVGASSGLARAQTTTVPTRLTVAPGCTVKPLTSMGVYSVLDYGAGAGQADQDTAAFKAALAAAKATNGTVVIPEGTYYINDTLSMTGKVSLVGLVAGSLATAENRSRVVLQGVGNAFAITDVPSAVAANGDALVAYTAEGQQGQRPLQRALLELEGGCAAGGFTIVGLGVSVPHAAVALMGNSTGVRLSNLHLRNVWMSTVSLSAVTPVMPKACAQDGFAQGRQALRDTPGDLVLELLVDLQALCQSGLFEAAAVPVSPALHDFEGQLQPCFVGLQLVDLMLGLGFVQVGAQSASGPHRLVQAPQHHFGVATVIGVGGGSLLDVFPGHRRGGRKGVAGQGDLAFGGPSACELGTQCRVLGPSQ